MNSTHVVEEDWKRKEEEASEGNEYGSINGIHYTGYSTTNSYWKNSPIKKLYIDKWEYLGENLSDQECRNL